MFIWNKICGKLSPTQMQYIIQASLEWYISLGIIYNMDRNLMFLTKDLSCIYYIVYKNGCYFCTRAR